MSWDTVKLIAVLFGIGLAALSVSSACWIWVRKQLFGFGGSALCTSGVVLIGLSIWHNVQVSAPPSSGLEVRLSELEKALSQISTDYSELVSLTRTVDTQTRQDIKEADKKIDELAKVSGKVNPGQNSSVANNPYVAANATSIPVTAALGEGSPVPAVMGDLSAFGKHSNWESALRLVAVADDAMRRNDKLNAMRELNEALEVSKLANDSLVDALIYLKLYHVYRRLGNLEEASQTLHQALAEVDREQPGGTSEPPPTPKTAPAPKTAPTPPRK